MNYEDNKALLTYRLESYHALVILVDELTNCLTDSEARAELDPLEIDIRPLISAQGFTLQYLDRFYDFTFRPLGETPRQHTLTTTMRHSPDDVPTVFKKVFLDDQGNIFPDLDRPEPVGSLANRASALSFIFDQLAEATEIELA